MKAKLLFVCTGNTCRSPMAAGLARQILGPDPEVFSAGLAAWDGDKASDQAIIVAKERGFDLGVHQARRVDAELLAQMDWIIPMTRSQENILKEKFPQFSGHIRRLGAWGKEDQDVSDPWGGSVESYRHTARQLERMLQDMKEKMAGSM